MKKLITLSLAFAFTNLFGQNPQLLKDIFPGNNTGTIQRIVKTSNYTFFNQDDDDADTDRSLFRTDGTNAGTIKLNLTYPGYLSTKAELLTALGNKVVFAGDNFTNYGEIWASDGTQAGTVALERFQPNSNRIPVVEINTMGSYAYYSVINKDAGNVNHAYLRRTDGTAAGTSLVYDFSAFTGVPQVVFLTPVNNILYFIVYDQFGTGADQLWRSDGTNAGTYIVYNFGLTDFVESFIMPVGNSFYMMIGSVVGGIRQNTIWKSDGTAAGTGPVKLIGTGNTNTYPPFAVVGSTLYFAGVDGNGKELWQTDGTAAGTYMVADINPGAGSSNPLSLTVLNNELYFSAANPTNGGELWKYSGGVASLVKDINPGAANSAPGGLTVSNNTILFNANNGVNGGELWISDGTAANTVMVADINPGAANSVPNTFTTGNPVYFAANNGTNGFEVYKYDNNGDAIGGPNKYYVNDNSTSGDLLTFGLGSNSNNGSKLYPFATINYAITQATEGDTIYVDAGTYTEQVTIDKGLTIIGAGQNLTSILKPAVTIAPPGTFFEQGVIQTSQSITGDVHIHNLSVTGDYSVGVTPIIIQSGGSVKNCKLQNGNQGIFVRIDPNIALNNKTFVVDGNTINAEYIAVNFAGGIKLTASLTNNTIAASNPGFSSGTWAGADFGTLSGLTITGNLFSSYVSDGLYINSNNCSISQNSFLGTGQKAINKFGGSTINATCNWYGSSDLNVLALKITSGITFSPWLVNGTDNSSDIGFQPVPNTCIGKQTRYYVFNNTSVTRIFTTGVGNDANPGIASSPMATITGAYQKAQSGDSIYVDAGTYDLGGLTYTFPKPMTFLGTNYLVSPNDAVDKLQPNAARNAESIITNFTFQITANDLSFEGFTIDQGNRSFLSLTNANYGRLKVTRNHVRITGSASVFNLSGVVATDPALLTSSDYLFDDNRFNRSASGSGSTFSLNYLKNIALSNNSAVITGPTTRAQNFALVGQSGLVDSLSLTGNVIDRANYNLFTLLVSRLYITGNKFYNASRDLFIQTNVSGSSDVLIENNEIVHNIPGAAINTIISCSRFSGNLAATNVARIRNNNIMIDATGLSFVPAAISGFNAGTLVNPVLEISGNKIFHSGNLSSLTSIFSGVSVTGNLLNASINANELANSGTNYLLTPANSSAATSSGIQLATDAGVNTVTAAAVININNNKLSGYKQSVILYDFSTSTPNTYTGYGNLPAGVIVNINNNSFTGDSISINNGEVGQSVNATCNWYGSVDAAVVVPKISVDVNYSPWLTNGTDNDAATGFQPVANICNGRQNKFYVNDNSLTGDVFSTGNNPVGNDANPGIPSAPLLTIAAAYNKAQAGDTIFVDAGTYAMSNLTISKSIAILGTNYLISPNDANNKTLYNTGRNAESRITGGTLVMQADWIYVNGMRISSNTAISMSGNYSHIKMDKNYFDMATTASTVSLSGSSTANDYAITDNRFERQDASAGDGVFLSAVASSWIDNNTFIELNAAPFRGFGLRTAGNADVSNVIFTNNYVKKLQVGVLPFRVQGLLVSGNMFDSCSAGYNQTPQGSVSNNITISSNTFNNLRVARSVLVRGGTNGGVNNLNIQNNIINQAVDGISGIVGMIQLDYAVANAFGATTVSGNKINISGNYANTGVGNNPGIMILGEHTNTTISKNEITSTAINAGLPPVPVLPPVPTGIFINTDPAAASGFIPSNAIINITNNKISGFKNSIAFYDPSASNITPNIGYGYLTNGATVIISNNSFVGDSMSIDNGANSQPVQATCNWYGSAAAQNIINKVTLSTIDLVPWLTNGTDAEPLTTGFQPAGGACDGYPALIVLDSYTDVTCNGANNGTINITTTYGKTPFTYTWTKDGDPGFVSHAEDPTGLAPGTYHLLIVDGNGSNIYITDPEADGPGTIDVTITEPPLLTAAGSGTNVSCFGGSNGAASVSAGGGTAPYTYLWSNGATTSSISGLIADTYSVTVTDDNGCTAQASYIVTQPALLTAVATGTSTTCANSATVVASGGTAPYTYEWSNLATSQSITSIPAGTYTVTVKDANLCTTIASVTVTAAEAFNPSASITNVSCFGKSDGVITVTNANGTAPFTFSIDGINFAPGTLPYSFYGLAAGIHTVAVRDVNGCTGFVSKTIIQPTALVATLNTVQSTCFGLSGGAINVSVAGGSPSYSNQWTGPNSYSSTQLNISGLAAGNYSLTVTDSKGCNSIMNAVVSPYPEIIVDTVVTDVLCKDAANGSINLTVTGGTGSGFTYLWNNGVTTQDRVNLGPGNYSVDIRDIGSGCLVSRNFSIDQPSSVVINLVNKSDVNGCISAGSIEIFGSGGTAPYEYKLNNGNYQSSGLFTGLQGNAAGLNYTVWVKDSKGCTISKVYSIKDDGKDGYENNGNKNNATAINLAATVSAKAVTGDIDYFKLSGTNTWAGNYRVSLVQSSPSVSYFLTTSNGTTIVTAADSSATYKQYNNLVSGNYYVRVIGGPLYQCYQLTITNGAATRVSSELYTKNEPAKLVVEKLSAIAFPNPHQGNFTLQIESPESGMAVIQLLDANGKLVVTRNKTLVKGNGNTVSFTNIRDAILFYRVILNKQTVNGKIIGQY